MPTAEHTQIQSKKRGKYLPYFERAPKLAANIQRPEAGCRDYAIIKAVWQNRFLSSSLLRLLFPPMRGVPNRHPQLSLEMPEVGSPSAAPKAARRKYSGKPLLNRLSLLHHHGYLKRISMGFGQEIVYALGEKGAHILRENGEEIKASINWQEKNREVASWYKNGRLLSGLFIHHTLMVASFRVALELSLQSQPHLRLVRFEREAAPVKWRHNDKGREIVVAPDAFFVLKDHKRNRDLSYFAEIDRSTMSNGRMLEKYSRYALMYEDSELEKAYGTRTARVLTVTRSLERAQNLHDTLSRTDLARPKNSAVSKNYTIPEALYGSFYFTSEENFAEHPENVLASIWHRADEAWFNESKKERTRAIISEPLKRV